MVLALAAWALVHAIRSRPAKSEDQGVRTATVVKGEFVRTLRVTGTTEAMQSYVVSAPTLTGGGLGSLVITHLAQAGQKVKKGDLLVEFDRQNQIKNALDSEAAYKDLVEQIRKQQAQQAIARAKDESELHQAQDAVQSAALETRRNEVVSRIDAEKNLANLEEAKANFQQLQQTFQLKRQADAAAVKVLEIQRDRARLAMEHSQNNASKMEIRSPLDGVVVLNSTWKGSSMGEVQEGDEVRPGVPFLQVMNPGAMQVRARVNQADLPWLNVGQTVAIRPDAYPGLTLPGQLQRLAAIGVTSGMSNKVRTFTAIFDIAGSDPRLMPDLSVAIDIVLERRGNSLIVPRDALYVDAGGAYVWVKRGQAFEREAVKLGPVADDEAVVIEGLQPGDVVLRNPRKLPPDEKQK
ncbi:MAG: efflux RND transporter periplasmic adaptor subunit [Terriglobales bacterium]